MTVWKRAIHLARERPPSDPWWMIQEEVLKSLDTERGKHGWTEAECIDAALWAAGKIRGERG